jgi:hypothetical protein
MWRFRGTPHFLDAQGRRLGLAKVLTDRARHNAEIHRVSVLLGQLCERYHRLPKDEDGQVLVFPVELAQIKGTLTQCEEESAKLHALAASAQAMLDEAYHAFGIEPPERLFRVRCQFDGEITAADLKPIRLTGDRALAKAE